MINVTVYFNNFNLATLPGVRLVGYNVTDLPTRNLTRSKLARANRSVLTSAEYAEKNVTVSGFIGGDTWIVQQENLDKLKANLQDVEGILRIQQGNTMVEYVGTLNAVGKTFGGPSLGITLGFLCSDPIGTDISTANMFSPEVITTGTLTKSITVDGSFLAEPRYTLTANSITGGTNKTVSLLNGATGKGIRLTRNWVTGDIVTIASDAMQVTANAVEIDFAGQFPTFMPGSRTLQYIDDFTARNITLSVTYNRKYV